MTGEALDFGKIMGGDQDGRPIRAFQHALDQLIAYERIEACKRLVKNN
jgi:hypothetical protein